ncbi:hypothetical protein CCU68_08760 [Pseudomonas gingeri NCPPB 3146 = LMG 5327]|uniref:Uncharacterized protein n=1 Tax=Pseudomonas gingeri NCPPB 3146 = LMG 5327 TaxID=707248 RepID=A0ABX4Y7F7_9PSED|nr:hypothetical protein CCU68_08760 [Pseudomonas gingeri NCPPB 3146 = LMG 5327]
MSFSKNRARILPDLSPEAAAIFANAPAKMTFSIKLRTAPGKTFARRRQKAKLPDNQCRSCRHLPVFFARKSHAQPSFQFFIVSASFHLRRSSCTGRRPRPATPTLR